MPDPIKDALHAAALATMTASEREHADTCHNGQPGPGHVKRAAETVAAFHNRFVAHFQERAKTDARFQADAYWHLVVAAAVERAARDE